ncbi:3-oxoacyl-ACP reductase FabG [Ideonella sp. 4Y11]|uniref:3-oxoacyl-ACP reductase FabG n=1 Tax=Ideonella aquatica TaxID=2824119 RepID=A0A940YJ04_9BURK|nr:3-oxoacyl-ACP reductase family protein [Ideonella aquatica]MBQ0957952.1 3-oxoacyl-ACP reductase FabG [Ideonella aquatica]
MNWTSDLCRGRTALVTGGARGIGAAIAVNLARHGAQLVVNARTDSAELAQTIEEISALGAPVLASVGDVSDAAYVARLAAAAQERFGGVDILVNNAGVIRDKPLAFMKEEEWREVLGVSLDGAFHCSKAFVKGMMKRRWGRIINVSSISALSGRPGQANYSAAKAGLIGFAKSLAREVAPYNVLVNTAVVGLVDTRMTRQIPRDTLEEIAAMVPLQRVGQPREVADVCLFLASEMSSYLTATEINVSGGAYI